MKKKTKTKPLAVSGKIQLVPPPEATQITRSFSWKVNAKNHLTLQEMQVLQTKLMGVDYEVQEFFMSANAYAKKGEETDVSEKIHYFVKAEVMKSVNKWIAELHQWAKLGEQGKSAEEKTESAKQSAEDDFGNQ